MEPYSFTVDERPKVKERPRATRYGGVYTPRRTQEAEARVRAAYEGPLFEGLVCVDAEFHWDHTLVTITPYDGEPSRLRGDTDNYMKLVLDGLNGVAYKDDKAVVKCSGWKR